LQSAVFSFAAMAFITHQCSWEKGSNFL
jgi:hypothetical protein